MRITISGNAGLVRTLWAIISAAFAGIVIVIAPLPLNLLAFVGWILLLRRSTRPPGKVELNKSSWPERDEIDCVSTPKAPDPTHPRAMIAAHVVIVGTIIVVAGYVPVKQIDQILNRSITLPRTAMTLGEFAELGRTSHLHPIHFDLEPEQEKVVVRFPRIRMRLGEVIEMIEKQATFRRHISKCGNESTVLWGSCVMSITMGPDRPPGHHDSGRSVAQASAGAGPERRAQGSNEGSVGSAAARERLGIDRAGATFQDARRTPIPPDSACPR